MGMMCDRYEIVGHEVLEKTVGRHGKSGHVYLPKDWIGATVKVVRATPIVKVDE
jgi:putative transposon-encoded protein